MPAVMKRRIISPLVVLCCLCSCGHGFTFSSISNSRVGSPRRSSVVARATSPAAAEAREAAVAPEGASRRMSVGRGSRSSSSSSSRRDWIRQAVSAGSVAAGVGAVIVGGAPEQSWAEGGGIGGFLQKAVETVSGGGGEEGGEDARKPLKVGQAPESVTSTITYKDFVNDLFEGKIESAQFYGSQLESCVVTFKDGGEQALIGEGYPRPAPTTDESPYKVVSQLRNAGVPYKSSFSLGKNVLPPFRTGDEAAARVRQSDEEREIDEMMARRRQ